MGDEKYIDKRCVHRLHKELSKHNKKNFNPRKNVENTLADSSHTHTHTYNIWMSKKSSPFLDTRETDWNHNDTTTHLLKWWALKRLTVSTVGKNKSTVLRVSHVRNVKWYKDFGKHIGSFLKCEIDNMMVKFICHLDWAIWCPDILSNIILSVFVRVFFNEINIWISIPKKAN